jgi:hypothetical protein
MFSKWEQRSTVRNAPRRMMTTLDAKCFFSPRMSTLLQQPLVQAMPAQLLRKVEIQLLYRYLQFTEYLETSIVNKTIVQIMNDELPISLVQRLRDEAYKIYCDEAYHALQAHDTIAQLVELSGEQPMDVPIALRHRLPLLRKECPIHLLPLFDLFFVCISETLVSQELREHADDDSLHPSIKAIMEDHAKDEAIHALFFEEVMICLKEQLPKADFNWFLEMIPAFLGAYLLPDKESWTAILSAYIEPEQLDEILEKSLAPTLMQPFIKAAATQVYRIVERLEKANF